MKLRLLFLGLALQIGCGGGGGGGPDAALDAARAPDAAALDAAGDGPPPVVGTITGTAATGAPIGAAAITVKDVTGAVRTATTDGSGAYAVDVTGLEPPFLVEVALADGGSLFSVGSAAGTVNIHPFTDLVVRIWYEVQATTVEAAFTDPAAAPAPPSATEVRVIAVVVKEILLQWLTNGGVPAEFDLFSSAFAADGSGFDGVLDLTTLTPDGTVTIGDGATTQVTTIALDPGTGVMTVDTTTTSGSASSSSTTSAVVPTTTAQQRALDGATAVLSALAEIVNARGAALTAADLAGLYDAGYLDDGRDAAAGAAQIASGLSGATLSSFTVERVLAYDDALGVVTIEGVVEATVGGSPLRLHTDALSFKRQADGSWRFYGNQRLGSARATPETQHLIGSVASTDLHLQVLAPEDTVASVTASGNGETFTLAKNAIVNVDEDGNRVNSFDPPCCPVTTRLPTAGTVYTFTVTPTTGAPRVYSETVRAATTETIDVTSPTGHTMADARLGLPLTATWTLPTTFAVERVELIGFVMAPGVRCDVHAGELPPTATTASVTLPTTCGGQDVTEAYFNVDVRGVHGESTYAVYQFR